MKYGYNIENNMEEIKEEHESEAEDGNGKSHEGEGEEGGDKYENENEPNEENKPEKRKENKYSNEGKMELSFLDFRAHYDSWIPNKDTGGLEYSNYINNSKMKRYPMLSSQMMFHPTSLKGKEVCFNLFILVI